MAQPLLSLKELSKFYVNGQNVTTGLNKISLNFYRGEFVAITGESGSGKSTLAHILGGILSYEDGELLFNGAPTSHYDSADWEHYRRDNIAFISQNYGILPGATVEDNVISALRLTGLGEHRSRSKARSILRKVELWEMRGRRAAQLSSGQKQRLSIARALAKPCPILIADEPTGNLDPENSEKVIKLLAQAASERLVILITHEFPEAEDYATRHIALQDGRISMDAQLMKSETSDSDTLSSEGVSISSQESQSSELDSSDLAPNAAQGSAQNAPGSRAATAAPNLSTVTYSSARTGGSARSSITRKNTCKLGAYTAGLQLKSRPVWCAIVLLFFALTAFAVFAFLGTFITALDDTSTRIYDSTAFLNGARDRIVAIRKDGEPMTDEDYETILSINYVEKLERYGYIADTYYAYRPDVDYEFHYIMHNYGSAVDPVYIEATSISFMQTEQFAQTVPLHSDTSQFLTDGRLPENFYEVIAAGDSSMIGDELTVYLWNLRRWGGTSYIKLDVTVVGVTDSGSGLYFHDDVGKILTLNYCGLQETPIPIYEDIPSEILLIDYRDASTKALYGSDCDPFMTVCTPTENSVMRPIEDNEVLISFNTYVSLLRAMGGVTIYDGNQEAIMDTLEIMSYLYPTGITGYSSIMGLHDSTLASVIGVSPSVFRQYVDNIDISTTDQVSLTITDYSYTDRVIAALEKAGYYALSPYRYGSTTVDETLAAERLQTLTVCLGALVAVVALQLIVFKALFGMENDSYRILSNIGLTYQTAQISILLQVLLFTLLGQIIGFAAILLCSLRGVERIVNLTKYLTPSLWLLLSLIHLAVSLLATLFIMRSLKKHVYPLSARKSDLLIPGDVQEVAS